MRMLNRETLVNPKSSSSTVCSITFAANGKITFSKAACNELQLKQGVYIEFVEDANEVYLINSKQKNRAYLIGAGNNFCSVALADYMLKRVNLNAARKSVQFKINTVPYDLSSVKAYKLHSPKLITTQKSKKNG